MCSELLFFSGPRVKLEIELDIIHIQIIIYICIYIYILKTASLDNAIQDFLLA